MNAAFVVVIKAPVRTVLVLLMEVLLLIQIAEVEHLVLVVIQV
jgi:hypothetical protein